jgi:ATP-binding protein involved in chromosome partitioning
MMIPASLHRLGDRTLLVNWNDGRRSEYDVRALRLACPCASCVNEWTGERTLRPAQVPENIRPMRLFSVGRYALGIAWSDGHDTGIFGFDYLRRLDPAVAGTESLETPASPRPPKSEHL